VNRKAGRIHPTEGPSIKNEGKVSVSYRAVSTPAGRAASVRVAGKLPLYPISLECIVATDNIAMAWQKVKSKWGFLVLVELP
jgi:hypothetical protein